MKKKRRFFKTLLIIVFLIIGTIPFLDWNKKNKIHSRFNNIEFKIYNSIPTSQDNRPDLTFSYCDTVRLFLEKNPIEKFNDFTCENYNNLPDSIRLKTIKTDFIGQVQNIDKEYRRQERVANWRMFIILILSQVFVALGRKFIDKRYKDETIN